MRRLFSVTFFVAMISLASTGKTPALTFTEKLRKVLLEKKAAKFELGFSKKGEAINAWYFPGTSDKKALVLGGVHGSELSSIEVVNELLEQLNTNGQIYYSVIVIPSLFPDNARTASAAKHEIGSVKNIGRYSFPGAPDPNRQMPAPGAPFNDADARDNAGRSVEDENILLLQLIDAYRPHRIASVHAIRDRQYAGFFADPRTDENGIALGFASDSMLVIDMALHVHQRGGKAPGNAITRRPQAHYYRDPLPAARNEYQRRNTAGSPMPGYKGNGISLGTWASTAIRNVEDPAKDRDAIRIITIEFPGSRRPIDYDNKPAMNECQKLVRLYADAIRTVFLQEVYIENR